MQRPTPEPSGRGIGHVVRVAGDGAAEVLGVDARAAVERGLEGLEHEEAGALAHDETVAVLIPGAGGGGEVVVVGGERSAGDEAAETHGDDGRLDAARDHDVRLALADVVGGGVEGVVRGRARGGDGVVGSHEPLLDGEERAAHVGDGVRDEEGG